MKIAELKTLAVEQLSSKDMLNTIGGELISLITVGVLASAALISVSIVTTSSVIAIIHYSSNPESASSHSLY